MAKEKAHSGITTIGREQTNEWKQQTSDNFDNERYIVLVRSRVEFFDVQAAQIESDRRRGHNEKLRAEFHDGKLAMRDESLLLLHLGAEASAI